jgi:fibronectin type 3 domain-containing protein
MFIYFTLQSAYSRWGMWGLTEDITDLQTPKFGAIYDLAGMTRSAPPAPLGVTATVVDGGVHLQWEACFGAERYAVKRGGQDGGPYTTIATDVGANSYQDTTVSEGKTYYVISAINEQGESRDSAQIEVTF